MSKTLILSENEFNKLYEPENKILVCGSYGVIRATKCNKYIIKETKKENQESIFKELDILARLNSPYIIKPLAFAIGENSTKILYNKGSTTEEYTIINYNKFFYDLLVGLKYLHDNNIAHCDIKPQNIIIIDNTPIYIDFGISNFCYDLENTNDKVFINTIAYTVGFEPPEIAQENTRSIKGDIFSLGKTFTCLINKVNYRYNNIPVIYDNEPDYNEIITSMLSEIENRKNIEELLNMKYFSQVKKETIDNSIIKPKDIIKKKSMNKQFYYDTIHHLLFIMTAYNIETYIIFQCLHNIHRTFNLINEHNYIIFIYSHFYICVYKSLYYEEFFGINKFLKKFDLDMIINKESFIKMLLNIIKEMDCIITTKTLYDDCLIKNSIYPYFLQICDWNYPYNECTKKINTFIYLKNENYNYCNHINIIINKIKTSSDLKYIIEQHFKETDIIYNIIPKPMKEINISPDLMYSFVVDQVELASFDEPNHGVFGLIYRTIKYYMNDIILCNNIFDRIIKIKYYKVYDLIYGYDKLCLARKYKNLEYNNFKINLYKCSFDDFSEYLCKKIEF